MFLPRLSRFRGFSCSSLSIVLFHTVTGDHPACCVRKETLLELPKKCSSMGQLRFDQSTTLRVSPQPRWWGFDTMMLSYTYVVSCFYLPRIPPPPLCMPSPYELRCSHNCNRKCRQTIHLDFPQTVRLVHYLWSSSTVPLPPQTKPASEVFDMIEDLMLMEKGRLTYFGTTKNARSFFDSLAGQCPSNVNPAGRSWASLDSIPPGVPCGAAVASDTTPPSIVKH